tara:strand:+ start:51 stop:608 length:558 start_codon:yes stop_codon:yes gene_type:complete
MALSKITNASIGEAISSANMPVGSVLQTLQANKTDTQLIESVSFVDVLTKSITPSATSSGILVMAYVTVSGYGHFDIKVTRNDANIENASGTGVGIGNQVGSNRVRSAAHFYTVTNYLTSWSSNTPTIVLLDYPNTTSAITYKIKACSPNDAGSYDVDINRQHSDADALYSATTITTLTLQEIKG